MKTKKMIRCHIIGETTLCIRCADALLKHGHTILSIFSDNIEVIEWAHRHNLSVVPPHLVGDLVEDKTFDYLFSIVNNTVLKMPGYAHQKIINYHDGPLPRYAGRNASCWAILNNENVHGITWHLVTEKIDAGDIVKQVTFPLAKEETALSINLKCYEQAVACFHDLLNNIERNALSVQTQDLSQRSLYYASSRPYANGIICWEHTAEYIERLFRATYFGAYSNDLTTCKFFLDGQLLVPTQLTSTNLRSDLPPGTIVKIEENSGLYVSTATHLICISEAISIYNETLSTAQLISRYALYQGYQLGSFNRDTHWLLQNYAKRIQPHEEVWRKQLSSIENARLLRLCKT